ncbi:hypothetical protein F383_12839 [Gossypium arboreum]|uniref:Uncharacterized protein n=1 Tax=Gossypium arboreum TaxID=29729 RepID=A0A0B0PWI6_GOSAR|nr:hypothetical protein F383_12839 [Gossypium arboreum]
MKSLKLTKILWPGFLKLVEFKSGSTSNLVLALDTGEGCYILLVSELWFSRF